MKLQPLVALTGVGENYGPAVVIAQLAARQYGHVTRTQLVRAGMGAGAIQNRLEQGRLIRVHAGVYALDYRRPEPIARAAAAVLACGPAAVLSHQSAAALWGLGRWPAVPEVTTTAHIRRPAIRAHRSRAVGPRDATVQLGIRVTTPARTLRDLKPRLSKTRYTRAVNDARVKHILGDDDAERLLGHRRGPTRSEFEDAFQAFVTRYRLPPPLITRPCTDSRSTCCFRCSG